MAFSSQFVLGVITLLSIFIFRFVESQNDTCFRSFDAETLRSLVNPENESHDSQTLQAGSVDSTSTSELFGVEECWKEHGGFRFQIHNFVNSATPHLPSNFTFECRRSFSVGPSEILHCEEVSREFPLGMEIELELSGPHCRLYPPTSTPDDTGLTTSFPLTTPSTFAMCEIGAGVCQALGFHRQFVVNPNPLPEFIESNHPFHLRRLGFLPAPRYIYLTHGEVPVFGVKPQNETRVRLDRLSNAGVHSIDAYHTSPASWIGLPVMPKFHKRAIASAVEHFAELRFTHLHEHSESGQLGEFFEIGFPKCHMGGRIVECVDFLRFLIERDEIEEDRGVAAINAVYKSVFRWLPAERPLTDAEFIRRKNLEKERFSTRTAATINAAYKSVFRWLPAEPPLTDNESLNLTDVCRMVPTSYKTLDELKPAPYNLFDDNYASTFHPYDELLHSFVRRLFNSDDETSQILWEGLYDLLGNHLADNPELSSVTREMFRGAFFFIDPLRSSVFWTKLREEYGRAATYSRILNILGRVSLRNSTPVSGSEEKDLGPFDRTPVEAFVKKNSLAPSRRILSDIAPHGRQMETEASDGQMEATAQQSEVSPDDSLPKAALPSYSLEELTRASERKTQPKDFEARRKAFFDTYFVSPTQVAFAFTGIPLRDSKANVTDAEFACSSKSVWPTSPSGGPSGWISEFMCEVLYNTRDENYQSEELAQIVKDKPEHRTIGLEFENVPPYRCELSYLANEPTRELSPFSASLISKLSLGFCNIQGFKGMRLTDDSFHPATQAYLRHVSSAESGETFYSRLGFDLSGGLLFKFSKNQTCTGFAMGVKGEVSGICHSGTSSAAAPAPDGFGKEEAQENAKLAKQTLFDLTFDCHDSIWDSCAPYYSPMERIFPSSDDDSKEDCRFQLDPHFKFLSSQFPNSCGFGKRIGECHREVRHSMECYRDPPPRGAGKLGKLRLGKVRGEGCKYLEWLAFGVIQPDDQIGLLEEKFAAIGKNLTSAARPELESSLGSAAAMKQSWAHPPSAREKSRDFAASLLRSSTIFVTSSSIPEFWRRSTGNHPCKPAWAWRFLDQIAMENDLLFDPPTAFPGFT